MFLWDVKHSHQKAAVIVQEQWPRPLIERKGYIVNTENFPNLASHYEGEGKEEAKISFKKEVQIYYGKTKISILDTEFKVSVDF